MRTIVNLARVPEHVSLLDQIFEHIECVGFFDCVSPDIDKYRIAD